MRSSSIITNIEFILNKKLMMSSTNGHLPFKDKYRGRLSLDKDKGGLPNAIKLKYENN